MYKKKIFRFFKISYFLRKFFSLSFIKFFLNENFLRRKIFKYIFDSGYWLDYNINNNQSRSGKGSNINRALFLKESLKTFFKKNKIKNIVDIGCGDFNWMNSLLKEIDYDTYLGIDIVESLIKKIIKISKVKKLNLLQKILLMMKWTILQKPISF